MALFQGQSLSMWYHKFLSNNENDIGGFPHNTHSQDSGKNKQHTTYNSKTKHQHCCNFKLSAITYEQLVNIFSKALHHQESKFSGFVIKWTRAQKHGYTKMLQVFRFAPIIYCEKEKNLEFGMGINIQRWLLFSISYKD